MLGCTLEELHRFEIDGTPFSGGADLPLHPASVTWPMGFSWSSAVAQEVTVAIVLRSGFLMNNIICDSEELPESSANVAVVATDDTIFIGNSLTEQVSQVEAFDAEMHAAGVPRPEEKDVNGASTISGLGCHLTSKPARATPDAKKLHRLVLAILGLDLSRRASPKGLHAALGLSSWFCILSRPHYSCFSDVYNFVRLTPAEAARDVQATAVDEMCVFLALFPLLQAHLDRPWLPLLTATDAAPEYGFGGSVCEMESAEVARLGRKSERRGDFVRLARDDDEAEAEKRRIGRPHSLRLNKSDFRDVLCVKAKRREHAGVMEIKGVLLLLKWVLRSQRRFGHRLVMLIDAKAALSAVAKGRTGSAAFWCTS